MTEDWKNAGFGVYVHWPFCKSKCPYCDFNSHVHANIDQHRWANALSTEIAYQANLTQGRHVDTIFFGGGTPSLMSPETVNSVLEAIHKHWTVSPDVEISMEANPTSVEADNFKGYAAAGVNRLSMGIQALNDTDLRALGRLHTASEAMQTFDIAKKYFRNVSFDLIYARQNQTLDMWRSELDQAVQMAVDHLSLYQLTIEQGTRFGDLQGKGRLRDLPTDQVAVDMYKATQDICNDAGLPAYEVSNHARVGAECQHNLIYWRYGDYAGIGPGAHGRLTVNGKRYATESTRDPQHWLTALEKTGHAVEFVEALTGQDQFAEYLLMCLRLDQGCNLDRLNRLCPNHLNMSYLHQLDTDGFLQLGNESIRTTAKGRLVLNSLLGDILTHTLTG